MKKIIALLLFAAMVVTTFASCGFFGGDKPTDTSGEETTSNNDEDVTTEGTTTGEDTTTEGTTTAAQSGLEKAKEFVDTMYAEAAKETMKDFTVAAGCMIDGVKYTITWTIEIDEEYKTNVTVGTTEGNDTTIKVVRAAADIAYKLVATIKGTGEETIVTKFDKVVPAVPAVAPSVVEAPEAGRAYKFFLSQDKLGKTLYLKGEMDGYYIATTEDYTEATDVYLEAVDGGYKFYFMNGETKAYISVVRATGTDGKLHNNVTFEAATASVWTYDATNKTLVTVVNVDGTDTSFYLGTYSNYSTISASTIDKAPTSYVGHLAVMVESSSISDADKIATEKDGLTVETTINTELELPAAGRTYADVTITWAVTGAESAKIENGKLTVTQTAADQTLTLTATLKCGETTDTKEFTITVRKSLTTPEEIVNAAYALEKGAELGEFTLTGIVKSIDGKFNEQYKSIVVTIIVNNMTDKPIQCYNMKADSADAVSVGDEIKVTGTIKNYKGTIEFDQGCTFVMVTEHTEHTYGTTLTDKCEVCGEIKADHVCADGTTEDGKCDGCGELLEIPELTIPEILAATTLGSKVIVKGKVTSITYQWSDTNKNMSVVISDADGKTLTVYKLATKVEMCDEITVTGTTAVHNDVNQIGEGATAVIDKAAQHTYTTLAAKCDDCGEIKADHVCAEGDTVDSKCDGCGATILSSTDVKATVSIAEYATANNWVLQEKQTEVKVDDKITMTIAGGSNSGKFYNNTHIRVYSSDSPAGSVTFTAAEGYVIKAVKISTLAGTYAALQITGDETADYSNVTATLDNVTSVTFTAVANGGSTQTRITGVEVVYAPVATAA